MLRNACVRVYLGLLLAAFFATGGLAMFALAPLYKLAFAPQARWRDIRPLKTWAHVYKIMWRSMTRRDYRELYPSKLTDPPVFSNDPAMMRIRASWRGAADNCDGCALSCCAQIKCPMLDGGGRCLSYGSIYFGYYFCGRYPSSRGQVELYNCPKWEVRPVDE